MTTKRAKFLTHQSAAVLNKSTILNYIKKNAPVSRTDIWKKMGLSRASVTQIIKQLIDQGFIMETGTGESTGGRKPCFLEFVANSKFILVFDWHLKTLFLMDMNSDVVDSKALVFHDSMMPEELCSVLKTGVSYIIKNRKLEKGNVLGLGIVMPGLIDPVSGTVIFSSVQKWRNVQMGKLMESITGMDITLGADGQMQALGEYFYGAGRETKDFALMSIEDVGIGVSFILNGEIQSGNNNMSGEIGHIVISDNGPECACGKKGCLEAFILNSLNKKGNKGKTEAARYIGLAISVIVNILDPNMLVLTGNVIEDGNDEFLEEIMNCAKRNILNYDQRDLSVEKSSLGNFASIKGICGIIYDKNYNELNNLYHYPEATENQ